MTWFVLFLLLTCKIVGHSRETRREAYRPGVSSRPVQVSVLPLIIAPTTPSFDVSELVRRNEELEKDLLHTKQEIVQLKNKDASRKENLAKYREENKAVQEDDTAKRQQKKRADAGKTRPVVPGTATGKRRGKHKGSKGGGFKRPTGADRTKHWHLKHCPSCRASLAGVKPASHHDHFIIDLEQRSSRKDGRKRGLLHVITRHVIYRYRCPRCGKVVSKDLGWFKHRHYGVGMVAFMLRERVARHGSWAGIRETAGHVFGEAYVPTIQACIDWVRRLEEPMAKVKASFIDSIKVSAYAHSDETGLPMDGKNWWLWVVATAHVVLFMPNESRGHEAIASIFDGYKGVLVSDFFSAYNMLDVEQQKCLAHLVVELKKIEHEASKKAANGRATLAKDDAVRTQAEKSNGEATQKRPGGQPKQIEQLTASNREEFAVDIEHGDKEFKQASTIKDFFKQSFGDGPMGCKAPPEIRIAADEAIALMHELIDAIRRDGPVSHDIERLLKRLEKFDDKIFTYLEHEGVPPDNLEVERVIRYFVAQRKISGKFISPDVVAMESMLLSVYHTCKLNGVAIDGVLEDIIKGDATAALNKLGLDGDRLPNPSPPPLPALAPASS